MSKKYQIIYADPPWQYKDKSKSHGGGAESHYMTTGIDDLCEMPVNDISAKDSVMFMWVTYPMLAEGLRLMDAWGFTFKTVAFTWVKTNKNGSIYMGMGRHTRGNAEIVILGTKGKGVKRVDCSIRNTQLYRRGKHSAKPIEFRAQIEKLYGITQENTEQFCRLEMFAREAAPGWDVFGSEAPNSIEL